MWYTPVLDWICSCSQCESYLSLFYIWEHVCLLWNVRRILGSGLSYESVFHPCHQYCSILPNIVQLYPILVTSPNIAITNINHQWLYSIAVEFNSLIYKDLCAIVTEQLVFCLGDPPSVEGASKMVTSWCNFWNRLFFLWFEKIFDTFVLKEAAPWVARSIFSSWKRLQWAYMWNIVIWGSWVGGIVIW